MKIVSFYADVDNSTAYSDSAKQLMSQCEALKVEYMIVEQNFGDKWIENVRAKPLFLLNTLNSLKESFIWLDCDCSILKPIDFEVKSDWGVYMRENGTPHDFVHYVSNTAHARNFLELWVKTVEEQQRGSHTAFISIFDKISSEVLPAGYFQLGLAETTSKQDYFNNSK